MRRKRFDGADANDRRLDGGARAGRALMTKKKPLVVVTRRLPELVETRMRELFDSRLNLDDKPMSQAEIVEAMREADVLVPTITDHITAPMIAQAGEQMRLIANFG